MNLNLNDTEFAKYNYSESSSSSSGSASAAQVRKRLLRNPLARSQKSGSSTSTGNSGAARHESGADGQVEFREEKSADSLNEDEGRTDEGAYLKSPKKVLSASEQEAQERKKMHKDNTVKTSAGACGFCFSGVFHPPAISPNPLVVFVFLIHFDTFVEIS